MGDGNAKGFLALPSRGLDTDPNIEEAVNSFSIIVVILLVCMVMFRMAAMMMKSLTWHKSRPVEEALL